jgi:hypothetical protein
MKRVTKADLMLEIDGLWRKLSEERQNKFLSRVAMVVARPYAETISTLTKLRNDLMKINKEK